MEFRMRPSSPHRQWPGLFSAKFKPFAVKERTIRKLADQSLLIPLSKGPEIVMLTGRIEAKLSVHSFPESSERGNAGHPRSTPTIPRWSPRSELVGSLRRRSPRSSSFPRRSQGCAPPISDQRAAPGNSPAWPTPPRVGIAAGSSAPRSHWCEDAGTPPADDAQVVSGPAESRLLCSRRHVRRGSLPLSCRRGRSD